MYESISYLPDLSLVYHNNKSAYCYYYSDLTTSAGLLPAAFHIRQ